MCGIAGIVGGIDADAIAAVARMTEAQAHRGPDQEGTYSSTERGPGVALGHRRLSIIDLSDAGRQPMTHGPTGVTLVFNGEVYNFLELRRELEAEGARFVGNSDTEVILRAYLRDGEGVIERLRGMFALAMWDPRTQKVLLARDRLGVKPLYVHEHGGRLAFASEVRALLASGAVPRKLDPRGLERYLWNGFVPGPGTIIEGVRLLDPGTTVWVGLDGRMEPARRYWTLPRVAIEHEASAVEALEAELAEAVRLRLVADVPLGVFLSGGVDSSVVAALAQRASDRPVRTFTLRFEESAYDESVYARRVATALGTDHQEIMLSEGSFALGLDAALASIDQPTFDAINTYFVSRAVREAGLTVALAGTGGDELFGGYSSFGDLPQARALARGLGPLPARARGALARLVTRLKTGPASEVAPQTRFGKLEDVLATGGDRLALYQVSYGLFTRSLHKNLVLRPSEATSGAWGLDPEAAARLRALIEEEPDLHAISTLELASFLGERLLRDTDAASMAVSLEVRVPLIDHRVVEAAARVPATARYEPLGQKQALRRAVRGQLDPSLFDREKAGFELPLGVWCKNRLRPRLGEALRDVVALYRLGLDGEAVGRLVRAFEKGGPGIYWSRVWALFVLLDWCQRHGVEA